MNNRVIINNLLTNVDEQIVRNTFSKHGHVLSLKIEANEHDRFAIVEFESDKEALDAVNNVKMKFIQSKPCLVRLLNYKTNEIETELDKGKQTFNDFSSPYANLICDKIHEAISLLNAHRAKLSDFHSMRSRERTTEQRQHVTINRESSCSSQRRNDPAEKQQLIRTKLYPVVTKHFGNDAREAVEIISRCNIEELEKFVEDENILLSKIAEIKRFMHKEDGEQESSVSENIDYEIGNEGTSREQEILSKLYLQLEFREYLSGESLNMKLGLCATLYPSIAKYAGPSTELLVQKFMELDNGVLKYLTSNENALQKKMYELMQSGMSNEFINKLGFYGKDAMLKINDIGGNINNQYNELGKIKSTILGLQNWLTSYAQFLSTLTALKQNVHSDLNNIITDLSHINIELQSTGVSSMFPSEPCSTMNTNAVQGALPINPLTMMQSSSMVLPSNCLVRPFPTAPNPYFANQNNFTLIPFFNNVLRPQYPPVTMPFHQNNINSSILFPNNHPDLQNVYKTTESNAFDKIRNSNDAIDKSDGERFFEENILDKMGDRNSVGVYSNTSSYRNNESLNNIHDENNCRFSDNHSEVNVDDDNIDDNTDGDTHGDTDDDTDMISLDCFQSFDELEDRVTPSTQIKEKKVNEHNEIFLENLNPIVDKELLASIFDQFGDILSIRVMRDPNTHQSLGIAYVTYANHSAAKTAMERMNFRKIHGKKCHIKYSESDKNVRKSSEENIFIKNLDLSIDTEQVYNLFKLFGEIVSCKVQTNENGVSLGFAFVRFDSKENAEKAINEMNGKLIGDKIIYVGKFLSKKQRKTENADKEFTNCYVNNFGTLLNDESLCKMFEDFGKVKSAKVELDNNGVSKGFGFVSFFRHEDAAQAVKMLNGNIIDHKSIYVGQALKKAERQTDKDKNNENNSHQDMKNNIYINKLNKTIDDEQLRNIFSVFGPIISAKVMRNKEDETSLGYGFVCYRDPKDATDAILKMNGKEIEGQKIYVNLCQKQTDKVKNLQTSPKDLNQQNYINNFNFPVLINLNAHMATNRTVHANMLDSNDTKEHFGNILYPRVQKYAGNLTGKVVGMFLGLDNQQIEILINNDSLLLNKVSKIDLAHFVVMEVEVTGYYIPTRHHGYHMCHLTVGGIQLPLSPSPIGYCIQNQYIEIDSYPSCPTVFTREDCGRNLSKNIYWSS